jgi:hypothetical protein
MWNKPWGAKRMTRAQKLNRRADALRADRNRQVLREAALLEPAPGSADAVRLERPLAAWRQRQMAGHVARAKRALESGGGGLMGLGGAAGAGASLGGGGGSLGGLGSSSSSSSLGVVRPYGSVAAAAAAAEAAGTEAGAAVGGGLVSAWAAAARAVTARVGRR